jgi:hypothetical protein
MLNAYESVINAGDPALSQRSRSIRYRSNPDDHGMTITIRATPECAAAFKARIAELEPTIPADTLDDADDRAAARRHDAFERLVTGPEPPQLVVNLHAELADLDRVLLTDDEVSDQADADGADDLIDHTELADAVEHEQPRRGPAGPADVFWSEHHTRIPECAARALFGRRVISPSMMRLLRHIGCDASVRVIIDDHGAPLDLGRTSRDPSRKLRRYILRRDHHRCRWAGCHHQAEHIHHIRPWTSGGATDRINLVAVCRYHHRLLHHHGWHITGNPEVPGDLGFRGPEHIYGETPPPLPSNGHDATTLVDDPSGWRTAPRYYDGTMDLDLAVTALVTLLLPVEQWSRTCTGQTRGANHAAAETLATAS